MANDHLKFFIPLSYTDQEISRLVRLGLRRGSEIYIFYGSAEISPEKQDIIDMLELTGEEVIVSSDHNFQDGKMYGEFSHHFEGKELAYRFIIT